MTTLRAILAEEGLIPRIAAVKMMDVIHRSAKGATELLTIMNLDGSYVITAKRDQVDPSLAPPYRQVEITNRAGKLKKLASLIKGITPSGPAGSSARVGMWDKQESWSDNSGYVVVSDDPLTAEDVAQFLPRIFPIFGGGVAGSTGYRGAGWKEKGPREWVWEESSFGIGD